MKRLCYRLVSRLVHQPGLLRGLAATLQRLPALEDRAAGWMGLATRPRSVAEIFLRDESFSNTSHAPNLVAGPFAIGLESGPRHDAERAELVAMLPAAQEFADGALASARASMGSLLASGQAGFDLVEDYMLWVAWAGLRTVFGPAAAALEASAGGTRGLLELMRHPGAHLIIGQVAPHEVQERATLMGSRLRHVVQANVATLRKARPGWRGSDEQIIDRSVGLLWVAHPATVQAGALVMQEWLAQPDVLDELQRQAHALGPDVWDDTSFRQAVKTAAVQALQRRPAFPLLVRDVPRDASFAIDDTRQASRKAGLKVVVLPVAAMAAAAKSGGCPLHQHRTPLDPQGAFGLVFGMGRRDCIGQNHAIETVTSGLIGLLTLPALTWADPAWRRIGYDGPIIVRMRLRPRAA